MHIGGYTQAHLTLWVRRMVGSGGNVTTQEVGTYLILFILVILQSLVNSLISIARKRERERERKPERQRSV